MFPPLVEEAQLSQGAYLDYVGAPQAAAAAIARFGKENPMAAGYQAVKGVDLDSECS